MVTSTCHIDGTVYARDGGTFATHTRLWEGGGDGNGIVRKRERADESEERMDQCEVTLHVVLVLLNVAVVERLAKCC